MFEVYHLPLRGGGAAVGACVPAAAAAFEGLVFPGAGAFATATGSVCFESFCRSADFPPAAPFCCWVVSVRGDAGGLAAFAFPAVCAL